MVAEGTGEQVAGCTGEQVSLEGAEVQVSLAQEGNGLWRHRRHSESRQEACEDANGTGNLA